MKEEILFWVVMLILFVIFIIVDRIYYEKHHIDGFDRKNVHPLYDIFMGYKDDDPIIYRSRHRLTNDSDFDGDVISIYNFSEDEDVEEEK